MAIETTIQDPQKPVKQGIAADRGGLCSLEVEPF